MTKRGYVGWSKSVRAEQAENDGKFPLTKAIKAICSQTAYTKKEAREALMEIGHCEWHHTSKMFNKTKYYNVNAAILYLKSKPLLDKLPNDWREKFEFSRHLSCDVANRCEIIAMEDERLAAKWGVPSELLSRAYYGSWED